MSTCDFLIVLIFDYFSTSMSAPLCNEIIYSNIFCARIVFMHKQKYKRIQVSDDNDDTHKYKRTRTGTRTSFQNRRRRYTRIIDIRLLEITQSHNLTHTLHMINREILLCTTAKLPSVEEFIMLLRSPCDLIYSIVRWAVRLVHEYSSLRPTTAKAERVSRGPLRNSRVEIELPPTTRA